MRPARWYRPYLEVIRSAGKPRDFSDDNRWINAQRIEASGGMFI
jgi:hypothetical protein